MTLSRARLYGSAVMPLHRFCRTDAEKKEQKSACPGTEPGQADKFKVS